MATHPYISGPGNITQMIGFLRRNFPATVNSDTVKKLGLASKNESYVINALQFIGVIDENGKRTDRGHEVLATHDDDAFKTAFEGLIRDSYKDLFELHGDNAWALNKNALIGYFRSADKTSDVIGTRQASVFQAFRALAGHEELTVAAKASGAAKTSARAVRPSAARAKKADQATTANERPLYVTTSKKDMALTSPLTKSALVDSV